MDGMVDTGHKRGSRFAWALPGASLAVFAAASLALFSPGPHAPAAGPEAGGKTVERLSFVQEDIPTRQTRIYDTLAMFSLPRAEPVAWTETATAEPQPRDVAAAASLPDGPAKIAPAGAPPRRLAAILPPTRPVELASAAVTPRAARPGPMPSLVQPMRVAAFEPMPEAAEPAARGPVEILGVTLPGTQYWPTGRDTMRTLTALGSKTREMGATAGSAVGEAFSAATDAIVETVGLR